MSGIRDTRPFSRRFLEVGCPCGKTLRAGIESAGSTIQCWSCRAHVPVPVPRDPGLARSVLRRALGDVFAASSLVAIAAGVLALLGLLILPLPGLIQAALGLIVISLVYGELIRRGCWARGRPLTMLARVIATLAVALLPMTPWLMLHETGGTNRPPALYGVAVGLAVALAVLVPLVMMVLWGARYPGQVARAVIHQPAATLAALLIVPLGLVAGEVLTLVVTNAQGMFSYYVLDLYPDAPRIAHRYGIPLAGNYSFPVVPDTSLQSIYAHWLYRGMPLSMALPASLGTAHVPSSGPWPIEISPRNYFRIRAFHTGVVAVVWLTTVVIQAYWLGLIARIESRFDPPAPAS